MTWILITIGFFIIIGLEYNNPNTMADLSIKGKVVSGIFHSIAPRTAGFNTLPTDQLTMASIFYTIVLMFIGGFSGGTAGGVKITTAGIVIASVIVEIKGNTDINMFGRRISRELISRGLAIITLSMGLVVVVTMVLSVSEVG